MHPTAQYHTEYFWKFATEARRAAPGGDREAIAAPVDELCMIAIRRAIEVTLNDGLPETYDEALFNQKCDGVYRHIFDAYHAGSMPRGA